MFGYSLVKTVEVENLKVRSTDAQSSIERQAERIKELESKVAEYETTIATLTAQTVKVKNETAEEKTEKSDKPVKKIRRRSSKKNAKKEE
jgi:uncharacterized coiled-coil protein SlyX